MAFSHTILTCGSLIILLALSVGGPLTTFRQDPNPQPTPRKIDEWGGIGCDDLMARIDHFAGVLKKDEHSRAFIVSYSGPRTLPGRLISYAQFVKPFLINVRGIAPERIINVMGGKRERITIEVWAVPAGAMPPVPNPLHLEKGKGPPMPVKFDEGFADYLVSDGKTHLWTRDMDCITDGIDLRSFSRTLEAEPSVRGHVLVYNECGKRRARADVVGRLVMREVAKEKSVSRDRLRTVYGGCRDVASVELWLLPPDVSVPKPSPGKWMRGIE